VRIRSFAKVNLGLEVLGLRPDGYHDLRTLFQSISLTDKLDFLPLSGGGVVLHGSDPSIPWDESNLVLRAARALKNRYPCTPGARIELTKSIPAGKGLGGGSSNAAATLLGLDRLWGLGLNREELMDIGRSLGADVPYFLRGGLCLGLERGDRIVPLHDLPVLPLVIALPPFSCSTADIFREHRRTLVTGVTPPGAKLTSPLEDSRIEQFFRSSELRFLENNLEATVFRFHPRLQDLKALFRSRGAELSLVTGSGSAVFGLFRDKGQAEEARRAAEEEYPAVLAETVPRGKYEGDLWAGV
jgi:4-diphosphocytidyl-2-C-methyl-D-erythritol kinase